MNTMEAISWFCGLGGSALGAVLAGARVIAAIDYDDWMLASHELNMRDVKAVNFDMQRLAKLDPSTIALARDLLISFGIANPNTWEGTHVFTAPCPGFSKGGRMNPNDPRNRLIFAMIPILAATPKSRLIFENVPTFLAEKYKDIHTELFNGIRELRGYELDRHFLRRYVLYGPDYGLFQTRKRLIFPIMQNGESFPNPPPKAVLDYRVFSDAFGPSFVDRDARRPPMTRLEKRLVLHIEPGEDIRQGIERDWFVREYAEENGLIGRSNLLKVASRNAPMQTVVAKCGANISRIETLHPDKRRFTHGEVRRAQGIPDKWVVLGSSAKAREMIGNAVPPVLLKNAFLSYIPKCD